MTKRELMYGLLFAATDSGVPMAAYRDGEEVKFAPVTSVPEGAEVIATTGAFKPATHEKAPRSG